jgi:hypothetical protein
VFKVSCLLIIAIRIFNTLSVGVNETVSLIFTECDAVQILDYLSPSR